MKNFFDPYFYGIVHLNQKFLCIDKSESLESNWEGLPKEKKILFFIFYGKLIVQRDNSIRIRTYKGNFVYSKENLGDKRKCLFIKLNSNFFFSRAYLPVLHFKYKVDKISIIKDLETLDYTTRYLGGYNSYDEEVFKLNSKINLKRIEDIHQSYNKFLGSSW